MCCRRKCPSSGVQKSSVPLVLRGLWRWPEPAVGNPSLSSEAPAATSWALAPSTVPWVSCSGSPDRGTRSRQRRCFFPPWLPAADTGDGQPHSHQSFPSPGGSWDVSFPSCPSVAWSCSAVSQRAVGSGSHLNSYFSSSSFWGLTPLSKSYYKRWLIICSLKQMLRFCSVFNRNQVCPIKLNENCNWVP